MMILLLQLIFFIQQLHPEYLQFGLGLIIVNYWKFLECDISWIMCFLCHPVNCSYSHKYIILLSTPGSPLLCSLLICTVCTVICL